MEARRYVTGFVADNLSFKKMSLPRIVHQLWLGGEMPSHYLDWHRKASALNPGVEFWLWHEDGLANTLGLNVEQLRADFPSWAGVSNVARLHILHQFGGLHFDIDYEPIKPLDEFFKYGDAVCLQEDGRACNSYFQCMPGSEWIGWQLRNLDIIKGQAAYAGVNHMTRALQESPVTILPTRYTYPWNFDAPDHKKVLHADTIMCHHWAKSWLPNKH
jgi:mannosyltransferase OCH1-like enzyme